MTFFYKQVTAMADAGEVEALEALLASEREPWRRNLLTGTLRRLTQPRPESYAEPMEIDFGLEPMTYSTEELLIG
jgi:hypothetical protein